MQLNRLVQTRFRYGSVSLTSPLKSNSLAHYAKGTPSRLAPLRPLVSTRFQVLFHSPPGVLFTFPSRYLFTIGLRGIFSLGGWSPQLRPGLHVSRATQDPASVGLGFRIRGYNPLWPDFSDRSPIRAQSYSRGPTTPAGRTGWFGLFPVRSPLLRESLS